MTEKTIKAGVVGGTGYAGVELLRLLAGHPAVTLSTVTSRVYAHRPVAEVFANLRGHSDLCFSEPHIASLAGCDVVFFATPNGTAMTMARELLDAGVRIIDLAADFRLRNVEEWQQWYRMEHTCPELLQEAVYGLPEINRAAIRTARLVANPGCYPTAIQLGFLPLIEQGTEGIGNLIADAKSGVSGAGRNTEIGLLFSEATENFKAYAVDGHRHLPEIRQGLSSVAGRDVELTFVPHLTPMIRGIHATLYAVINNRTPDIQTIYEERFQDEPFVDVLPPGAHPETRSVKGTNLCRIALHRPQGGKTLVVMSVIDNLVKGAAGQAMQNMNLMFGQEEIAGLEGIALLP